MANNELAVKIIESSDNLVYASTTKDFELLYMNHKLMDVLGLNSKEDYMGKKCYKVLQGKDNPCEFCTNSLLNEKKSYQWQFYNPMLKRNYSVVDKLIQYQGALVRVEMATDITEEVEIQKKLLNRLTVEETLVKCIQTLTECPDAEDAINRLLRMVAEFYEGDRGYIFEFNYPLQTLDNTYEWCRKGIVPQIETLQGLPLEVAVPWIEEFKRVGEFYIKSLHDDLDKESPQYKILESQQIDSLITAPMIKEGVIIGFIGVDNPKINMDDLTLIKSITFFILDDVQKRELMKKLEHMSYSDILTQTYNRNKYMQVLRQEETRKAKSVGILYMDLNGLKIANDTYGHDYGDHLIMRSAQLLQKYFPNSVYRLGGDEFLVLSLNIPREDFEKRVELIRKTTATDREMNVSLGSIWSDDSTQIEHLITLADKKMYEEKKNYYEGSVWNHYNYQK